MKNEALRMIVESIIRISYHDHASLVRDYETHIVSKEH